MRKSVSHGPIPTSGVSPGETESTEGEASAGPSGRAENEQATHKTSEGHRPTHPALVPGDEASLNDARLVELARHGDHEAFAVLVRRYERKLIRVLARLVHDAEIARDLAQETFLRVYLRFERFDTAQRFGPWLFRVGVNLSLDWLRKSRIEPAARASIDRTRHDGQLAFELPDPDPRIQADLAQEVQHILAQLPVSYRTILVLRDLEGFSSSEVAAIVGRREGTVRWRLAMARDKFREIWQRRHEEEREEAKNG